MPTTQQNTSHPGTPPGLDLPLEFLQQQQLDSISKDKNLQSSSRYKTELCRPFEEFSTCKYGDKCQFAHGLKELRSLNRHPKYKTELCRTFHTLGLCPYGHRCHFVHSEIHDINKILQTTGSLDTANAYLTHSLQQLEIQERVSQQQQILLQALNQQQQLWTTPPLQQQPLPFFDTPSNSPSSSSLSSSGGSSPQQQQPVATRLPVFWNF